MSVFMNVTTSSSSSSAIGDEIHSQQHAPSTQHAVFHSTGVVLHCPCCLTEWGGEAGAAARVVSVQQQGALV
jgi:hypothetical protein